MAKRMVIAGRYEVLERLGSGRMGTVYRVLDKKFDEEVALKLLRPEVAGDEDMIERLRNELKTARKIIHPNVTRMYEFGEEQGRFTITMEYVPGEDLKSYIRRSRILPIQKAVDIACQICRGLIEAHRLRITHNDIKPRNIMIDNEGNAKILDFGIAPSIGNKKGFVDKGGVIGTPEYLSPEQIEGKEADQRSNIYSLGAVLFEMVTGKPPFEGDTALSPAIKQKQSPLQNPRDLNREVPEGLSRLILKCLEKSRDKRYASVKEFLAELQPYSGFKMPAEILLKLKDVGRKAPTRPFRLKTIIVIIIFGALFIAAAYFFVSLKLKTQRLNPAVKTGIGQASIASSKGDLTENKLYQPFEGQSQRR